MLINLAIWPEDCEAGAAAGMILLCALQSGWRERAWPTDGSHCTTSKSCLPMMLHIPPSDYLCEVGSARLCSVMTSIGPIRQHVFLHSTRNFIYGPYIFITSKYQILSSTAFHFPGIPFRTAHPCNSRSIVFSIGQPPAITHLEVPKAPSLPRPALWLEGMSA